ncbi:MAG: hypothetical protein R2856_13130 [Caldilineaceae bacterium]
MIAAAFGGGLVEDDLQWQIDFGVFGDVDEGAGVPQRSMQRCELVVVGTGQPRS